MHVRTYCKWVGPVSKSLFFPYRVPIWKKLLRIVYVIIAWMGIGMMGAPGRDMQGRFRFRF